MHFRCQMSAAATAGGTKDQLARSRFGQRDEVSQIFCRHGRMYAQHIRRGCKQCTRLEIACQIERQIFVGALADGKRSRYRQQRIAVRRGTSYRLGPDIYRGAAAIGDHELLPERFRKSRRKQARRIISARAGRERHHDTHSL